MENPSQLFIKNAQGKIVVLESFFVLFPGQENNFNILFGGKVLEIIDEVSGSLATLFVGQKGEQAVHVGEEVLFLRPIRAGEAGKVTARVVLNTEKIICIHVEVFGGGLQEPQNFTKRYEGFGLCAVIDEQGNMVKNLEPYFEPSPILPIAQEVIRFQKKIRQQLMPIS